MKITLFWPVSDIRIEHVLPLGITLIAQQLKNEGFEVAVIDSYLVAKRKEITDKNLVLSKCIQLVEKTEPDIVGIGAWGHNISFAAEFIKQYKAKNPHTKIILGGYNATYLPNEILNILPEIDYLVRGEAEFAMSELCSSVKSGIDEPRVFGISYYSSMHEKIIHLPDRTVCNDLDSLPIYDFDGFLYLDDEYVRKTACIELSRGCVARCSFCTLRQIWPQKRKHSLPRINQQLKHLTDMYGIETFCMVDDNIVGDSVFALKFAKLMQDNFAGIGYGSQARVDMVSESVFRELKKGGLHTVGVGVESPNPKVLRYLNKTSSPQKYISLIPKSLRILTELGFNRQVSFISGTPYETKRDLQKLETYIFDILDKYPMEILHFPLNLQPGCDLWQKYLDGNIKLNYFPDSLELRWFSSNYKQYPWMASEYYDIVRYNISNLEYANFVTDFNRRLLDRICELDVDYRLFNINKDDLDIRQ